MQSTIPLYGFGGGGSGGTLTVTAPAGCTVTLSKGSKVRTKTAGSDGAAVFKGLEDGEWTVKIQSGTDTAEDTVQIDTNFSKEMSFDASAEASA